MRKIALVFVIASGLLSASCSSGGGSGQDSSGSLSPSVIGAWSLDSLNGLSLPIDDLTAWRLTINADKTWKLDVTLSSGPPCSMGGVWSELAAGTMTVTSTQSGCGSDTTGTETWKYTLSNGGDTLTIVSANGAFIYTRV